MNTATRTTVRTIVATAVLLCAVLLPSSVAVAAAPETASTLRPDEPVDIDAWVTGRMVARDLPGAAVAVVRDGEVIHSAGYGDADSAGREVTPDTPFIIGSTSKPFTAVVVGQLVDEGLLAWDEPVWPHLSHLVERAPEGFEETTVEQLLTHTGGFGMTVGTAGDVTVHDGPDALDRRVEELLSHPLSSRPGGSFGYSNAGFMLLASVVEQVTGRTFADELRDRVFDPLGMTGSFASADDPRAAGLATGHRQWFGRWRPAHLPYDDAGVAMGYIASTANDLATFMQAHLDGHPAIPATATEIARSPVTPTGWTTTLAAGYGHGWFVDEIAGTPVISHPGSLGHFTAQVLLIPEADGLGIAVLTNASAFVASSHEAQYDIGFGLAQLLLGEQPEAADPSVLMTHVVPVVTWGLVVLLLVAMVRQLQRMRRSCRLPARVTGLRAWARSLVPAAALIALGGGLLTLPLGVARHFYPDGGWAVTVAAWAALGWGVARLVDAAAAVRPGRAAAPAPPASGQQHDPHPDDPGDRDRLSGGLATEEGDGDFDRTSSSTRTHRTPQRSPAMNSTSSRSTRQLINRPVGALASAVRSAPAAIVALIIGLTAVFAALAGHLQDSAGEDGFMPDTPEVAAADVLDERFGDTGEEIVQVLVRTDGETLIDADGNAAATALEEAIRRSEAGSRIADVEGRPGVVSWLLPAQPGLATTILEVDDAVVQTHYREALQGLPDEQAGFATALLPEGAGVDDADAALIFAFVDVADIGDEEEVGRVVTAIADAIESTELPAGVTAEPFSAHLMFDADSFDAELSRLFAGAFGIIMAILAFVYWVRPGLGMTRRRSGRRSAADMLLSMAAIVMAILWMLGISALLGPGYLGIVGPMTEFTQVIPVLLIGLGVDYAIHLTSRYREEVGAGASVEGGVRGAVASVGGALLLATVTTAIGFLTNIVNPIPTLQDFGIVAAIGITAAFLVTLTFVPAARLLLDRRAERAGRLPSAALGQTSERFLPEVMGRTATLAIKAPIPTLLATVVLAAVGVFGMTQLETRFSQTDFVPEGSAVLDTIDELAERFNGGYGETTEVLLTGPVATPEAHNALVEVHRALAEVEDVVLHGDQANARSAVSVLASTLLAGSGGDPAPAPMVAAAAAAGVTDELTVPADADVTALYAALADAAAEEAAEVLAGGGSGAFTHGRVVIQTTAGEERVDELAQAVTTAFAPLEDVGIDVVATSAPITSRAVVTAIEESQVSSLAITLLVAMLLLVAVFAYEQRRPGLGVIAIVPVALVVVWTFGMMAATGIPFGPITATIAALAIGIGLPYAIHVVHRYLEDRQRHDDVTDAIRSTVRHTGGAMAGSAFTTIAGFGILMTSSLLPFRQLGTVMVYAVALSLAAATLVLPSILVLWDRWHHRTDQVRSDVETAEVAEVAERVLISH